MELILLTIIGALAVGLVIALFDAYKDLKRIEGQLEPLRTENVNLRAALKEEAEQNKVTLNRLREYYDEQVKREKQQIERFHEGRVADKLATLKALVEENEKRYAARPHILEVDFEFDEDVKPDSSLPAKK